MQFEKVKHLSSNIHIPKLKRQKLFSEIVVERFNETLTFETISSAYR